MPRNYAITPCHLSLSTRRFPNIDSFDSEGTGCDTCSSVVACNLLAQKSVTTEWQERPGFLPRCTFDAETGNFMSIIDQLDWIGNFYDTCLNGRFPVIFLRCIPVIVLTSTPTTGSEAIILKCYALIQCDYATVN